MAGEIPLILTLDNHGVPHRWVNWQQACFYYAKNLVAWTLGEQEFVSTAVSPGRRAGAPASPRVRSSRSRASDGDEGFNQCLRSTTASCFAATAISARIAEGLQLLRLTRDHIRRYLAAHRHMDERGHGVPCLQRSQAQPRAGRIGAGASLRTLCPEQGEYLILTNRKILADQMEFLVQHVLVPQSRHHARRAAA